MRQFQLRRRRAESTAGASVTSVLEALHQRVSATRRGAAAGSSVAPDAAAPDGGGADGGGAEPPWYELAAPLLLSESGRLSLASFFVLFESFFKLNAGFPGSGLAAGLSKCFSEAGALAGGLEVPPPMGKGDGLNFINLNYCRLEFM